VRVYARSGARLDHASFLEAIKTGKTFVTNGPLLGIGVRTVRRSDGQTVGNRWHGIGDELALPEGKHTIQVQVTLRSNTPVDHLELIRNGKVIASVPLRGDRTRADTLLTVAVQESGWYVVRAYADHPRLPILDLYPFASTSAFYVTVGGKPVRSSEDAAYFVAWIDRVREEVEKYEGWNTAEEKKEALGAIARAREEFVSRSGGA
jgi:hypothetical protein